VTPSKWLDMLVGESYLKEYDRLVIYNGIDKTAFRILDKKDEAIKRLRDKYEIDFDCKIILGVANIWDHRKGLEEFYGLSDRLLQDRDVCSKTIIVLIGVTGRIIRHLRRYYDGRIIGIKHTESVNELVAWYNLADVYVNPTLEDNFPTTNIEALSCGTPVVTYETGGSPESLDVTCGRVVKKGDRDCLKEAVLDLIAKKSKLTVHCVERSKYYDRNTRLTEYVDIMENMAGFGEDR
ncbi:MAG: glycosyltransferase, partial [Lachnospiraceae bacterium]|nr:glycosyltransferase [Lachnospiraceae bacterium]